MAVQRVTPAFIHWTLAEEGVRGEMMARGFTLNQADSVAAVVEEYAERACADAATIEQILRDLTAQAPLVGVRCRFCGSSEALHDEECAWSRAWRAVRREDEQPVFEADPENWGARLVIDGGEPWEGPIEEPYR